MKTKAERIEELMRLFNKIHDGNGVNKEKAMLYTNDQINAALDAPEQNTDIAAFAFEMRDTYEAEIATLRQTIADLELRLSIAETPATVETLFADTDHICLCGASLTREQATHQGCCDECAKKYGSEV